MRRRSGTGRVVLAHLLCRAAGLILPRAARQRYAAEWRADIAADPAHAVGYAASVLTHSVALRQALPGGTIARTPTLCRLHLHRYVSVHDNPEDRRFTSHHCTRCGHVKDDWEGPSGVKEALAWNGLTGRL